MSENPNDRFVIISGCSGGGKSTLLDELAARGWPVVSEPGRRIVRTELAGDGAALPWVNLEAFARKAIAMALADRDAMSAANARWVFFDRSLIDAAVALEHATNVATPREDRLYHSTVFITPPWRALYASDGERRHDFASAVEEYERLMLAYPRYGYEVVVLAKTSVRARADFILRTLAERA